MEAVPLDRAPSLRFADAARRLAEACRGLGIESPSFRSPPTDRRLDRSIRRRRDGSAVVAVRVRARPFEAVLADMIDGVVAANRLSPTDATACRDRLWSAALRAGVSVAAA